MTESYDALYKESILDREKFWAIKAEALTWSKKWDQVLDQSNPPFYKWFVGGKTNIVSNAIDRHLTSHRKNKTAILWEGETGEVRKFSYAELNEEVSRIANVLIEFNVKKGDIVTIYLPFIPEAVFSMLACAKIGALHSVVYGGFSEQALATRITDANSRVLITADGGYRRGKITPLKTIANEAMKLAPSIDVCLMVKRTGEAVEMKPERDHDLTLLAKSAKIDCATEIMDAEDPLFVLYTSGSTGKPKALVHTHGGYSVYTSVTHQTVFEIRDSDLFWCTADPGWITGHSYVTYGPLINGTSIFMYEGAPAHPEPDRFWKMIAKHKITILYTSPTAIRGLMRFGEEWPKKHDLSSLRLLGSVGEPINPEAWKWFHEKIGASRCPIMDTWWQTETGGFVITPIPSMRLKPGSATKPFYGHEIGVVDDQGNDVAANVEGNLVIKKPWPGMARTIFNDAERFKETYFKKFEKQGFYLTGDSARRDEDGYFWIIGRLDDVIKVSGYRLGTAEIESALVSHPLVAEAAAIGLPHELRGNAIHTYVILRECTAEERLELEAELKEHVAKTMGVIARPESVTIVDSLPKTRSGKIMRRVLNARAQGLDEGDLSTLEE